MESLIESEVAKVIRDMCQCDFQESLISHAVLLCEEELPTIIVYRARIFRYHTYSASQLVGYVDEWVKQGASVTIGGLAQVTFDQDCPVRVNNVDEPICVQVALISTTSPSLVTAAADQSLVITIVVVSVLSAVIFTVLITIIIVLLVHLQRQKKKL